jgi:hypothetical protein
MGSRIATFALGGAALLWAGLLPAAGQQAPEPGTVQGSQGVQAAPGLPDAYRLNVMIRTAIIALNQANQTGNYTVLRDLGATPFRMSNDPSRLAETFAALRKRQLDLSPILFFMPKLVQQPQLDQRGLLRLVGYFATTPERVNFDIYYLLEGGQWRLFGIGVLMTPDATASLPAPGNKAAAVGGGQPEKAAKTASAPAGKTATKAETRTASDTPAKAGGAAPDRKPAQARFNLGKANAGAQSWAAAEKSRSTADTAPSAKTGVSAGFGPN